MPLEDRLPGAMRRAMTDVQPPPGLAAAGAARGRRARRARAAGAVTAAAVAVGGTLAGVNALAGPDAPERVAAPDARPGVSARELTRTLTDLLPRGGKIRVVRASGTEHLVHPGNATVSVVYDDGRGPSGITVSLQHRARPVEGLACPSKFDRPFDSCRLTRRPDRSVLLVNRGYTRPQSDTGEKFWYAVLTREDGGQVRLEQVNSPAEKSTTGVTRPEPVLSPAQMSAVVTSPRWNAALDSLPVPVPAPRPSGPLPFHEPTTMSGPRIMSTLRALLPKDARVADSDGHNKVRLTDALGTTLVEVYVQANMLDAVVGIGCAERRKHGPAPRTCTKTTRPDGTVVYAEEGPLEIDAGGAVQRVVDVLHPDGRRVSVFAANGRTTKSGPRTRPSPALTLARLTAIATDPAWRR